MGLYLCIFDGDEDIDGVEVGSYADFNAIRDYVVGELEGGKAGSEFPTFILHSDCDGEWLPVDCEKLHEELAKIISALKERPAIAFVSDWQKAVAKSIGLVPKTAYESFIDVDGEFLFERLQALVTNALKRRLPILFQ
jgi:Immunity protein 70